MEISAKLGSHIRVSFDEIGPAVQDMMQMLTIENLEKEEALKRGIQGADQLDDMIELWGEDEEAREYVFHRGFASHFEAICGEYNREVVWVDERQRRSGFRIGDKIPLFDHQQKIVDAVLEHEYGILRSPTGSGKTVAALALIRLIAANESLVIVNTKEIAQQWIDRAHQWLGEKFPVSLIGDGEFEISRLTIAINATLWSRREKLMEEGFFDRFTFVCMDECHHANAETYQFVFSEFNARYRFGMSATPEKTGDERIPYVVLGPEIVEITEEDVEDQIMKPQIHVIETQLGFKTKGRPKEAWRRNRDYQSILKALLADEARNRLIAREIVNNHGLNANLVLSKRMEHFSYMWDALVDAGYDEECMFTIIGDDSRQRRKEVVERTEHGGCVIFSTLADEALDAPRLDRLHLTWPTRNPDLIRQQVGRIRRKHPQKKDALVIDYRDFQVKILDNQYMIRRHQVYDSSGWTVVKRKGTK